MSNLFGNLSSDPRMQRQALISRYSAARTNLLLMIDFSLVNILMLATNSGMYFLFSASIPYFITDIGMTLCGKYPEEFYQGSGLAERRILNLGKHAESSINLENPFSF